MLVDTHLKTSRSIADDLRLIEILETSPCFGTKKIDEKHCGMKKNY